MSQAEFWPPGLNPEARPGPGNFCTSKSDVEVKPQIQTFVMYFQIAQILALQTHHASHQLGQGPAPRGERRYSCCICGRGFRAPSLLAPHMRTHTGEKPFECDICGRGFAKKENMTKHRRLHDRESKL